MIVPRSAACKSPHRFQYCKEKFRCGPYTRLCGKGRGMNNRMLNIKDWETRAQQAQFCATVLAGLCAVSVNALSRHMRQTQGKTDPAPTPFRVGTPFLAPRLIALALLTLSSALVAASPIRLEGISTYELFSSTGATNLMVEEGFSMVFEEDRWHIRTELLSSDPAMQLAQVFAPPRQEAGSDGQDSYYLKMMSGESPLKLSGWVEPGSIPDIAHSTTASLLWLACCARAYLEEQSEPSLKPLWVLSVNGKRASGCTMRVAFQPNVNSQEFLHSLQFLSDGRVDPCNPSTVSSNMRISPWSEGYTQAVFQVERAQSYGDLVAVPGVFAFESLTPVPRTRPSRLRVFSRIRGIITNASIDIAPTSWLPGLPEGQGVGVKDHRFTDKITNWAAVSYRVTNQWNRRTSPEVASAVLTHARVQPVRRPRRSTQSALAVRCIIVGVVVIPLMVVAWRSYRKRLTE